MWYTRGYENTHFYPTPDRRRTATHPERIAFVRCFCITSLPDFDGFCSRGTGPSDCTPAGLRRPDCAQRAPRFQYPRPRRAARRVFAPPSAAHHLLGRRNPAVERVVAPQPARFRQRLQHLDLGTGCPGQLRAGDHPLPGLRRKRAASPQTTENQLETCQALDYQRRPAEEPIRDQMSLRFVTGRPVSDITTQFLQWGCDQLQAQGKTAWLLIGDNAPWHVSKLVRTWMRQHNSQVKAQGKGVRILPC